MDDILAKRGLLIENASDDEKVEEMEEEEQEMDDQVVDNFDQDFDDESQEYMSPVVSAKSSYKISM